MTSSPELSFDASLLADNQLDHDLVAASPLKRTMSASYECPQLSALLVPDLRCHSSELFQVTHHLRSSHDYAHEKEKFPLHDRHGHLHNDKIEKLLGLLAGTDFELDDQLRTRVFKGRFSKGLDAFDLQLDSYLQSSPSKKGEKRRIDDNKENAVPEPAKKNGSPKRRKKPTGIPLLQTELININNAAYRKTASPNRVCVPKRAAHPGRPSLKFRQDQNIFVVDSLTGSVNDATQFGTELNASNCEGFPMPEDANEIVQIPTNDTVPQSAEQKMAIIKAVHGKRSTAPAASGARGFYTKREFDDFRAHRQATAVKSSTKRVQWADELEW